MNYEYRNPGVSSPPTQGHYLSPPVVQKPFVYTQQQQQQQLMQSPLQSTPSPPLLANQQQQQESYHFQNYTQPTSQSLSYGQYSQTSQKPSAFLYYSPQGQMTPLQFSSPTDLSQSSQMPPTPYQQSPSAQQSSYQASPQVTTQPTPLPTIQQSPSKATYPTPPQMPPHQSYMTPPQQQQQQQSDKIGSAGTERSALGNMTTFYWSRVEYKSLEETLKAAKIPGVKAMLLWCSRAVGYCKTLDFCDAHALSKEEGMAIMAYTYDNGPAMLDRNVYYLTNRALSMKADISPYRNYILYLLKALRKLPVYNNAKKVLYRLQRGGVNLKEYKSKTENIWPAFTSASQSSSAVRYFAERNRPFDTATSAVFEITGPVTGYDISELSTHRDEKEVLLEPGTGFRVIGVKPVSVVQGLPCIRVEVTKSSLTFEEDVQRLAHSEAKFKAWAAESMRKRLGNKRFRLQVSEGIFTMPSPWDNAKLKALLDAPGVTARALERDPSLTLWSPRLFLELTKLTKNWAPLVAAFTKKVVAPLSAACKKTEDGEAVQPRCVYQHVDFPGMAPLSMEVRSPRPEACGVSESMSEPPDMRVIDPWRGGTTVHVFCADAMATLLAVARSSSSPDTKIGCLNDGDQSFPGGAWTRPGEPSLEADLFMCTTLSNSLEKYLYPIGPSEIVYTKNVLFFRGGKSSGYAFLRPSDSFHLDVFTVPAYDLVRDGKRAPFTDELVLKTHAKLNVAFARSVKRERDVLVLGPLGCGAFGNPPEVVAQIFRSLITVYAGYFSDIYFPIPDRETAETFARVLVGGANCEYVSECDVCAKYTNDRNFFTFPVGLAGPSPTVGSSSPSPLGGLCPLGGACPMLYDESHVTRFYHPPSCPNEGNCTLTDHLHLLLFSHK